MLFVVKLSLPFFFYPCRCQPSFIFTRGMPFVYLWKDQTGSRILYYKGTLKTAPAYSCFLLYFSSYSSLCWLTFCFSRVCRFMSLFKRPTPSVTYNEEVSIRFLFFLPSLFRATVLSCDIICEQMPISCT